jgi:hypothetical protein
MKRRTILAITLAVAVIFAVGAVSSYYYGRSRFVPVAVALLRSVTGLDVNFRDIRFKLGVHPKIQFDDGELLSRNGKLLSFRRLTVFYRYRNLLRSGGLPLVAIVVDGPRVKLPAASDTAVAPHGEASLPSAGSQPTSPQAPHVQGDTGTSGNRRTLPEKGTRAAPTSPGVTQVPTPAPSKPYATQFAELEKQAVETLGRVLATLGKITREFDANDAVALSTDGRTLVRNANLELVHEISTSASWRMKFDSMVPVGAASGVFISGQGKVNPAGSTSHTWAEGDLRFSYDAPTQFAATGGTATTHPTGSLTLVFTDDGQAAATLSLHLAQTVFSSSMLKQPTAPADYFLTAAVVLSHDSLRVDQASLRTNSGPLLQGEGALTGITTLTPQLTFKVGGLELNLAHARLWLAQLKNPPPAAEQLAAYVKSGRLTMEQARLSTQIGDGQKLTADDLIDDLHVVANLSQLGMSFPPAMNLPALTGAQARLALEGSQLTVSDVQARLGNSSVSAGTIVADITSLSGQAEFVAQLKASLSLRELYETALGSNDPRVRNVRQYLKSVDGSASLEAKVKGAAGPGAKFAVSSYAVELRPQRVSLWVRPLPHSLKLLEGTVALVPGLLTVKGLEVADGSSSASLDGSANLAGRRPRLRRLVVDLHQVEMKPWFDVAVKRKEATATGLVDGRISILGTPGVDRDFSMHGELYSSPVWVKLGILRSPVDAQTIVLKLHGRSADMIVEQAEFEGEKAGVEIKIPDVMRPVFQFGITVARLDLHALNFVHFPGHPKPPPKRFSPDTRLFGHVKLDHVQIDRLAFSNVTLDFDRRGNNWTISNISGEAYGGHGLLNVKGRSEDEILDVTGNVQGVDVAWFLTAVRPEAKPALSGRLNATADFRADTNDDFAQTLTGKGAFRVNDGTAYRLRVLARVLSMISVSGLLRGRLPDPFVDGIPFRVLRANLTAKDGVLHTKNLILDGPVLRMSAVGYVDLPSNTLNMTVGVMPFNMIDNVLSYVPFVGSELVGQDSLLAIYVSASGSASDPLVLPAPITSVTKILKKILTLPANIVNSELKPNAPDN